MACGDVRPDVVDVEEGRLDESFGSLDEIQHIVFLANWNL